MGERSEVGKDSGKPDPEAPHSGNDPSSNTLAGTTTWCGNYINMGCAICAALPEGETCNGFDPRVWG